MISLNIIEPLCYGVDQDSNSYQMETEVTPTVSFEGSAAAELYVDAATAWSALELQISHNDELDDYNIEVSQSVSDKFNVDWNYSPNRQRFWFSFDVKDFATDTSGETVMATLNLTETTTPSGKVKIGIRIV